MTCRRLASLAFSLVRDQLRYDAKTTYRCSDLAEGLPWCLSHFRLEGWLVHGDVVCVHVVPRHVEEFVLVLPPDRVFLELLSFGWWWRRVSDLGDEVCC
jgi:hypothetical protein